jgi:putative heme degradation protein
MIDHLEKQNQSLALEQPKRGRGRPATGAAMTPAEKQKAYRERQKKEAMADIDGQIKLLRHLLEQAREDNQRLAGKVLELRKDNDDLIKVLDEASKEKKAE